MYNVQADVSDVTYCGQVADALSRARIIHEELNGLLKDRSTERPQVNGPKAVYEVVRLFVEPLDHEELWVVLLDTRNRIMSIVCVYKGNVSSSPVRAAEIFRQAIIDNAPAIILVHNHPSGDPAPSPDDVAVTRAIVEAGKLLDIEVLDHLIIGSGCFASLKERHLM